MYKLTILFAVVCCVMMAKAEEQLPPSNQIWYTSTDRQVITPDGDYPFGALIVSNVYDIEADKGIITLNKDATIIKYSTFDHCSKLTSITLPNSITEIEGSAFYACELLESINIPASVTSIGTNAFADCSSLREIAIPDSVTSIEESAFDGCSSLTSVTIPAVVTSIKESAFDECTSLTSITIPASVTSIRSEAFHGCSSLGSVTFEGNLCQNSIADDAFLGVSRNNSILTLPDSWGNIYLPIYDETPWHGGFFHSNRYYDIDAHKNEAKAAIDAAMGVFVESEALHAFVATEISAINNATNKEKIDINKNAAIAKLSPEMAIYQGIYNQVTAEVLGSLAAPCDDCPAVKVTKSDTTITLYAPSQVEFMKTQSAEE